MLESLFERQEVLTDEEFTRVSSHYLEKLCELRQPMSCAFRTNSSSASKNDSLLYATEDCSGIVPSLVRRARFSRGQCKCLRLRARAPASRRYQCDQFVSGPSPFRELAESDSGTEAWTRRADPANSNQLSSFMTMRDQAAASDAHERLRISKRRWPRRVRSSPALRQSSKAKSSPVRGSCR